MNAKKFNYDVVVIGAGNGGLIAALTAIKKGLKTLLIEQHNVPGGFASSFVRGRFEFEPALHELGNLGNHNCQGTIYKLFKSLNINIDWKEIDEAFNLIIDNKSYKLPFGVEAFAKKCEYYQKNSYKKVMKFLDICKDCYDAVIYITETRGNPDVEVLKKQYPNYLTTASYSLHEVLTKLKMPKLIKFIIESYWVYLGSSPKDVSASLYAIMFYEYIQYKAYIPCNRSHEISQTIANEFQKLGGDIWFNTKVTKINVKSNQVVGVETTNHKVNTNHVISNISPHLVYGNLIEQHQVNKVLKELANFRKPGSQGFCIYLGLNKPLSFFNLKDYSYFFYSSYDHDINFKNMNKLETNNEYVVVCLNNANKQASEKDTSIISFTTLYNDAFEHVKLKDYFKIKNEIANRFIKDFETKMKIDIRPYIEEIEIATPVTFAHYTGTVNGSIYGYANTVMDSAFVRGRNLKKYELINGLIFCGGNGFSSHGYSITYLSGNIAANRTFQQIKEAKNEKK